MKRVARQRAYVPSIFVLVCLVLGWCLLQGILMVARAQSPQTSVPVEEPEAEMWSLVRDSRYPADVIAFLHAYPHGKYAPAARLKLQQLQRPPTDLPPLAASATSAPGSHPAPFTALRNSLGMEFVLLPAGEFLMGSDYYEADERPVHKVILSQPFYLGKYEVTQGQWLDVMGANPSHFKGDPQRPVERVSWHMVQEFIRRLNAREGHTAYRLPTEAEWEYAVRAGSTTQYSFGDDESQLQHYAWYAKNDRGTTHPVGQLKPNAWGLYDMHGNVWEWVEDWRGPYLTGTAIDPRGPLTGTLKGYRGGGWGYGGTRCRSANRSYDAPSYVYGTHGFRLARNVP
jgi:formylglycine-generating enzyme required for sulfatase activity